MSLRGWPKRGYGPRADALGKSNDLRTELNSSEFESEYDEGQNFGKNPDMNPPKPVKKPTESSNRAKQPPPFEPRVRAANEAGPRTGNVMTGTWIPHSMEPARVEGNNHLAIKSLIS